MKYEFNRCEHGAGVIDCPLCAKKTKEVSAESFNMPSGKIQHTPTPWMLTINKDGWKWDYQIRTVKPHNPSGGLGIHIATTNSYLEARGAGDAAFIVRAVNNHEDLIQSVRHLLNDLEYRGIETAGMNYARYRLEKAEGK